MCPLSPPRVLVESTFRVSPTHYPRCHSCKSQPAKSKSHPANTKISWQLAGQKSYVNKPDIMTVLMLLRWETLSSLLQRFYYSSNMPTCRDTCMLVKKGDIRLHETSTSTMCH